MKLNKRKIFSSARLIIFGFLGVILVGTFLLMLPVSSRGAGGTGFIDCLFTATSATCVTGLVVHDTATYWSAFGQGVILTLIQIGGMGVVTIVITAIMISGKKIGVAQRNIMQESISAPKMGGIVKMTRFIIKTTVCVELLCAAIMFPTFYKEFGVAKGIWYSIFHSVSAFCNAGFDLMGAKEKYSSLTSYVANPLINIVIMFLIVFGGLGFFVWDDLKQYKFQIKRYRLQTKVVLFVSGLLIILPAIYFFIVDFSNDSAGKRILESLFQSVTTRTAGFNTVDFGNMSEGGISLMTVLMLIGGSPGSTAGGMKTTTVAVLIVTAISVFKKRENPEMFGRRIGSDVVKNAVTVFMMYIVLFITGGLIISTVENLSVLESFFEAASAIGTVGLTLGVTPGLSDVSHVVLAIMMFCGRVGGLTLVFAITNAKKIESKLPLEKITVG